MSIKIKFTTLLLFISSVGFGQDLANQKTENHLQIPGTNVFMIPPDSFEVSGNFKGFQNPSDKNSIIMLTEFPGPFSKVTKGLNVKKLKAIGMELKTSTEIKIGEYNGFLFELEQPVANAMVF
ncbi:MAG: hypothetical protein H6607_13270 [Flavobacteriales bacterium]|nr:hypothetical protein [Flavobacteriales bacterium]